jgi:hypothetical protein
MKRGLAVGAVVVTAAYAWLQWLGRSFGASRVERHRSLPGDELVTDPQLQTTHATTLDASPERVWPWLVQMGSGRAQWYTARWVNRVLSSAERIVPGLQDLAVGDRILDGPPEANCSFVVAELEANRHLVLRSREHLPPRWAERYGAWIDFTRTFVLEDLGEGRTRILLRSRSRLGPWWVRAVYVVAIVPADFVMSRQMLRGVRQVSTRRGCSTSSWALTDGASGCWPTPRSCVTNTRRSASTAAEPTRDRHATHTDRPTAARQPSPPDRKRSSTCRLLASSR